MQSFSKKTMSKVKLMRWYGEDSSAGDSEMSKKERKAEEEMGR